MTFNRRVVGSTSALATADGNLGQVLRIRPHNLTLPPKDDRNFIARQLYKNREHCIRQKIKRQKIKRQKKINAEKSKGRKVNRERSQKAEKLKGRISKGRKSKGRK